MEDLDRATVSIPARMEVDLTHSDATARVAPDSSLELFKVAMPALVAGIFAVLGLFLGEGFKAQRSAMDEEARKQAYFLEYSKIARDVLRDET